MATKPVDPPKDDKKKFESSQSELDNYYLKYKLNADFTSCPQKRSPVNLETARCEGLLETDT